jgi:hypothetical protein
LRAGELAQQRKLARLRIGALAHLRGGQLTRGRALAHRQISVLESWAIGEQARLRIGALARLRGGNCELAQQRKLARRACALARAE